MTKVNNFHMSKTLGLALLIPFAALLLALFESQNTNRVLLAKMKELVAADARLKAADDQLEKSQQPTSEVRRPIKVCGRETFQGMHHDS